MVVDVIDKPVAALIFAPPRLKTDAILVLPPERAAPDGAGFWASCAAT